MMRLTWIGLLACIASLSVGSRATAAVTMVPLGSGGPVPTLGGYTLQTFIQDTGPVGALQTSVPFMVGMHVLFSAPLAHYSTVTSAFQWDAIGWPGYDAGAGGDGLYGPPTQTGLGGDHGDIYWSNGASTLTLTFSGEAPVAMTFFIDAYDPGAASATVSATGSFGTSALPLTQTLSLPDTSVLLPGHGGAITGFGIFASGGTTLTSVSISVATSGPNGFGIVFSPSIAIPAPGGLALLVLSVMRLPRRRR